MRIPVILAMVALLLQVSTDAYLFFIAWQRSRKLALAKFQLIESAFFVAYVIVLFFLPKRGGDNAMLQTAMWMMFIYFVVYAAKITFVIIDLLASIPLLWHKKRLRWLSYSGAVLGIGVALTMLWGAFINRFNIRVNEVPVVVDNLPRSFSGYRIAQISDLHVGTFGSDTAFVAKLVDRVNALHPDMIVFTGDIVNRHSAELPPFISPLSRLQAPDGVFSILGNHDYGDYFNWTSPAEKEADIEALMDMQLEMGWELLTNTSEVIPGEISGDSLVLIGVENWGDPPFPQLGDISAAYPTPADSAVKILLTHNPIHWVEAVAPADSMNIALTLSGHTHAMQMSMGHISPAAMRYKTWGGKYLSPDGKRMLYVNIGIGTVSMPMRIGATPEITIFTLHPNKAKN